MADENATNPHPGLGGHDVDMASNEPYTSAKGSSMRIPQPGHSVSKLPQSVRIGQAEQVSSGSTSKGAEQVQDELIQASEHSASSRRPVETSIWDWDTPLDSVGELTSYYYELQGELMAQEQREKHPARTEFTIPYPVSTANGFAMPRRPPGVPLPTSGMKRKSTSDQNSLNADRQPDPSKRSSRTMSESGGDNALSPTESVAPPMLSTRSKSGPVPRLWGGTNTTNNRPNPGGEGNRPGLCASGRRGSERTLTNPNIPLLLPARKVFPIQIGDKLFRLSGASISSDGPSYFSQFFEEQLRQNEGGADNVRTLYIDRDPATFEDISLHLQGYHVEPRDGPHFVKLFADAQFFSLPRLTAQLFSSAIYIRIGDSEFQIPRDLFSNPGDSPNYFSLGFSILFTSPNEVFPGLSQRTLLCPPSILPPSIPNRSAKTFTDILHILKGYPVEIRSEQHRRELLRDARYFHLKGLEQRLIPHSITYNLARKWTEILLRLEDIRQSGISVVADNSDTSSAETSPASSTVSASPNLPGWAYYQRPYVDSEPYSLIVETSGDEGIFLSVAPGSGNSPARAGRAIFHRQALSRITSLFSVIANKMNLPVTQPLGLMMVERGGGAASLPASLGNTGLSEERVKVRIGSDADVIVDGRKWSVGVDDEMKVDERRRDDEGEEWVVKKSQWRLRVQPLIGGAQAGRSGMEVILGAVKIEAFSDERARNEARAFLG